MNVIGESNFDKLEAAGLIIGELPHAHQEVLDGLSEEAVSVLIEAYELFSEADTAEGHVAIQGEHPAFMSFIVL